MIQDLFHGGLEKGNMLSPHRSPSLQEQPPRYYIHVYKIVVTIVRSGGICIMRGVGLVSGGSDV